MPGSVDVTLMIIADDLNLLDSLRKALEPDNKDVPPNMTIEGGLIGGEGARSYYIRVGVSGKTLESLKRARASVDEILAIIGLLLKVKSQCCRAGNQL